MLKYFRFLIFSCLLITSNVFAILEIELTQGVDDAKVISILPFSGTTDNELTEVINNDLKNSGRFRLAEWGGVSTNIIDYPTWKARRVEAVVTGQMKLSNNGQLLVRFQLYDIYNQAKIFEKEYQTEKTQLRKLAHHISDIIYQQLTGDRGVFSTKIAYVFVERHGRKADYKLQVSDSDGYNNHTLLVSKFPLMSPAWSPDGKKIAYVSFEGHRAAIYAQELATGRRELLTKFPGINGAPAWSPDGSKMALVLTPTGYPKIYVLDLATKNLTRITDGWYLDTEPCWANDGNSLIFTSNRGGSSPQIYQVNIASKKVSRLTFNGKYNARASFTPKGDGIVMLHQEGEMFTIAHEDLRTSRVTFLTRSGLNESPSIAPNGKMIVYGTNYNGRGMLAEVSIDGKVKLLLPAGGGEVQEPSWSPFLN